MEDINLLLSYIETEVIEGKRTIMGNGIIVNGENVLNLVKRIRISLNELDGSNVLAEANDKAQKIVDTVKREQIETITAQNVIRNLNQLQNMLKGVSTEVDSSIKYFADQVSPNRQSKQ